METNIEKFFFKTYTIAMNKKILLIANTTGSILNFRYGLIKRLLEHGYSVYTLAPFYSQEAYSKNAVEELESWGVICKDFQFNSKGMNPIEDLLLISRYKKAFKSIKPDIILSYTIKSNIYGSIAARKVKIPIISNITGLGNLYSNPSILTKIADFLYKWGFKKNHTVFFQNQDDMDLFLERKNIKLEQCGRLAGSGINLNKFTPMNKTIESEKIRFLTIARLIWDKGIGYYIDAIKLLKKKYPYVEFQILGEMGVNNPAAIPESIIREWIDNGLITYLGTSSDVKQQIRNCDAMVLPSIYREGVPRTLIEGAALGKPIITTNNVGCKDTVDDGFNGFLCNPKDSEDLASKLEKFILLSNEEKHQMGLNSRIKAEKEFDEEIIIKKYYDIIKSVLN